MKTELVAVSKLKPHPRNYRKHPADQLEHLKSSIKQHGFYRNVVVAKDDTILAGHGVVEAARSLKLRQVPVYRLPVGPTDPRALKVLAADNEIALLADVDDRALTELLKEIMTSDPLGLVGTGYDKEQLAALAFATRPAGELKDENAARSWLGLPEYDEGGIPIKLVITFKSEQARKTFCEQNRVKIDKGAVKGQTWSTRWPWTDREDNAATSFRARKR